MDVLSIFQKSENTPKDPKLEELLNIYPSREIALSEVADVLLDAVRTNTKPLQILRELYHNHAPFRYSIENKV